MSYYIATRIISILLLGQNPTVFIISTLSLKLTIICIFVGGMACIFAIRVIASLFGIHPAIADLSTVVYSLVYTRYLIKRVIRTINSYDSLCHRAGYLIKIVPLTILCIPALHHASIGIIAHPLAAAGFLIHILIDCHLTGINCIQPVPSI